MKNMILYATDVHGNVGFYEKMLDMAIKEKVKAVIIGGDIGPGFDVNEQRFFLEKYLIPRLKKFKKTKIKIFIIMGNDDWKVNVDLLEIAEKNGILNFSHNKVHKLFDKYIAGYSFVNPFPFIIRDWEKKEEEIKKDLSKLAKLSDPKKTVYVIHAPPFETNLDVFYSGFHAGSEAIKNFILKKQPLMTLHGHIHESCYMSGHFMEKIGKTISVNPSNNRILLFDLDNPENMKLINSD